MGDAGQTWMPPRAPHAFPLGKGNIYPTDEGHAVSVSLPTWDSVIGLSRKENWVLDTLEWSYPRFYINRPVRDLADAVRQRLHITDNSISCMVFCTSHAAHQFATTLKTASPDSKPETARFSMPAESNLNQKSGPSWANFSAAVFPSDLMKEAMGFWRDTGTGLSSRQAIFCLQEFEYLDSDSGNPTLRSPAPRKRNRCQDMETFETDSMQEVKSSIAKLATSEQPGQPAVSPEDVFLYPSGMKAIYDLSESLAKPEHRIAAYGWIYPETVEVIRRGVWGEFLTFKDGTQEELDHLESILKSGHRIHALFCELPNNVKLCSPDIFRIRALADQYGFIVACDDTVAGYVNIDALPYVDVMVSSLTKTFSGASNVTAGRYVPPLPLSPSGSPARIEINGASLVVNPDSRHHDTIHAAISATYENTIFPPDLDILRANSQNVIWRVQQYNENTLPLVSLFQSDPQIATVHHPSVEPTKNIYKRLLRKNGGYANVVSIIFHSPRRAEYFYNIVNMCKGSSFGTNFTLAVPYVQLAYYWNREKVPKYGVPQHIIRISVGLEESGEIVRTVAAALEETRRVGDKGGCVDCGE